jgi:hypothetical protein
MREFAHDERFDKGLGRLFVVRICPYVSYVRICQADDLPGVTWIGENFLIAGKAGVENDFAATAGTSARRAAVKDAPILEREYRATCLCVGQRVLLMSSFRRRIHG